MAWKKNIVKADLRSYPPYLIMGMPKSGKTTLFRDLVLYNYKSAEKGLLISMADEEGYHALDELQVEVVKDWDAMEDENGMRGLVQLIDDLVDNKEQYGLEMIGLDTLDKMVELAIQEVYEIHRRLKGSYPVSLNAALGGYGAGGRKVAELLVSQITKLNSAGYAVFILAHIKKKDKEDVVTGEVYEQITNSLMSTFYNPVADICQMIVNIISELEFNKEDSKFKEVEKVGANGKKTKELVEVKSKRAEPRRMMYFRDSGFVDAGGRFNGLPEKLELSAENFMLAFETGVKNSKIGNPLTDKEIEEKRKVEEEEIKENAKIIKDKIKKEAELDELNNKKKKVIKLFNEKAKSLGSDQLVLIKKIMETHSVKSFDNYPEIPMVVFEEILSVIE